MIYNALKLAHVLSIIVWIGGMVFAHFFLRPAAQQLEPPQRVPLLHGVLQRFLGAVAIAIVVVLTSGLGMIGAVSMGSGGAFSMPLKWTIMATLGLVMMQFIFGRKTSYDIIIIGRYGRKYRNTSWTVHQPAIRIKSVCHTIDRDRAIHYQMTITIIIITITAII